MPWGQHSERGTRRGRGREKQSDKDEKETKTKRGNERTFYALVGLDRHQGKHCGLAKLRGREKKNKTDGKEKEINVRDNEKIVR